MKFKNTTANSIYIQDIDHYISFDEDEIYELDLSLVKKSQSFQNMVVLGALEVVEHGNSRIEKNLIHFSEERKKAEVKNEEEEPRMESGDTPDVIIKGHFYEAGGYAKVNRNLAYGLACLGVNVEISPLSIRHNDLNEIEARSLSQFKKRVGKDAIRIDSIIPTFSEISSSRTHRILYTTIEAGSVRQQVVDVCNQYHEIWVTSDFCKKVLSEAGVKPNILVMQPGINTKMFHEDYEPHEFRPSLKKFVFCSLGQWQYRKGWDALLRSYLTEFSGDDDVSLLLISRQQGGRGGTLIKKEVGEAIKKYGGDNPAHVVRCSRVIPEYELPRVYKACDVFVLPSRGEGFCVIPSAKIRTEKGIKEIQDICVNDRVYTHRGKLSKVSDVFRREYTGKMISIYSYGRSNQYVQLTPNHKIRGVRLSMYSKYISNRFKKFAMLDSINDKIIFPGLCSKSSIHSIGLEWIDASKIKTGDYLFFPRIIKNEEPDLIDHISLDRFNFSDNKIDKKISNQSGTGYASKHVLFDNYKIKIDDKFSEFLGYYISEGCATERGDIILSFSSEEDKYTDHVVKLGKEIFGLNFKKKYAKDKCVCEVISHSVVIANMLRSLCGIGDRNKVIPNFVFTSSDNIRKSFLKTIMRGDGYFGKQNGNSGFTVQKCSYSTGSFQLANDMLDLLHGFGVLSSLKHRKVQNPNTKEKDEKSYWSVIVSRIDGHNIVMSCIEEKNNIYKTINRGHKSFVNKDFQLLQVRKVEEQNYNGDVCNIGVDGDNSYICENIAVHNCLPFCEASLCGLPVVATNHSGHTMFLNGENSILVDIDRMERVPRGTTNIHYWDEQLFPSLKSEEFCNEFGGAMRDSFDFYDEAKDRNKLLQEELKKNYSVLASAQNMKNRIDEIWKGIRSKK